jgi:16S rRNA (adenine1518-N6/adenine1519-N6)-dimethyltransferase
MRNHEQMRLFAKKSLGQHFLNSSHVLEQIITAGRIVPGEHVLEIGPGTGILTRALLEAGAKVIAIEKDHRASELLKTTFSTAISSGSLTLISGDILDERLLSAAALRSGKYALIANIPYYITGAILEKFLEHEPRPNKMVLLVQKEVADRIIARPERPSEKGKESVLSISVKAFGSPKMVAKVPPGAFTPPPSIDSAVLAIDDISDRSFASMLDKDPQAISGFFEIVKAGFAHKRKILKRNLESVLTRPTIERAWAACGFEEKIRAEDLSISDWLKLYSLSTE